MMDAGETGKRRDARRGIEMPLISFQLISHQLVVRQLIRKLMIRSALLACLLAGMLLARCGQLAAETVVLKNGMQFRGAVGKFAGMANPVLAPTGAANKNDTGVKPVVMVDDGLRRTFVPTLQVTALPPDGADRVETFRIDQRVAEAGFKVNTVGPALRVTQFDEWGRRIYSMSGSKGPIDVVQGITEITPHFIRVQGLVSTTSYVWDMRIATSSLPREILSPILKKGIDPSRPGERQRMVVLYLQADRMQDARAELEEIVKEFPDLSSAKDQVDTVRQMGAQRLIREIKQRREAGQHRLAYSMAADFPVDGVADATLLTVRDLNVEYEDQKKLYDNVLARLKQLVTEIEDEKLRDRFKPFVEEIARDLNVHTLNRMADFNRLLDDVNLTADQKVALGTSGWILGPGSATENSAVAASIGEVRDLVRAYLVSDRTADRGEALAKLKGLEGSSPDYVAKILAHMKPPFAPPVPQEEPEIEGYERVVCAGAGNDREFRYAIQLPPEYDPYRRYPCVVVLHGVGTTADQELDWWCGPFSTKINSRAGQATRQGYIVISPEWTREHQATYGQSVREHAAVLLPLRDAMKKFAIDTNRVFLGGHGMGADAAWDIGTAHPDMWAGVIPVGGNVSKFVTLYSENARYVPWYFVVGELDPARSPENEIQWDRYLSRAGYDITIAEFLGRGQDHYYDEVQRIFEWMKLHERNFFPREFKSNTLRSTDNFFWWTEVGEFPFALPPPRNTPPLLVESEILANNGIRMKTGARSGRVFISPAMLDFEKKMVVSVNGQRVNVPPPATEILLEDARTRGDRQNVFWSKIDF